MCSFCVRPKQTSHFELLTYMSPAGECISRFAYKRSVHNIEPRNLQYLHIFPTPRTQLFVFPRYAMESDSWQFVELVTNIGRRDRFRHDGRL